MPDFPAAPSFANHNNEVTYLLQILLPLYDNEQQLLPAAFHEAVRVDLTEKFGEVSVHVRSPAEGRWEEPGQEPQDEIVIYELMTTMLDEAWWRAYQKNLEARFRQEEIVIRVLPLGL